MGAAQLFDVVGLGVDIVEDSIRWAEEHSLGKYCHLDGRYVEWLPDDFFDGIISYAVLMHLLLDDQCRVVSELAGKLRVGGKMWLGWNAPVSIMPNDSQALRHKSPLPAE